MSRTGLDDELLCLFCRKPAGEDCISDDHGAIACHDCGEAEIAAQRDEGFWND